MEVTRLICGLCLVLLLPAGAAWHQRLLMPGSDAGDLSGRPLGIPEPAAPTPLPSVASQQRPRRRAQAVVPWEHECQLRSLALRVKDLGLGYASEETVLFKYCSGGCPSTRSNHDLALARLSLKGWDLPTQGEGKLPGGPCCRPTRYEDAAFLDDRHRWHEVRELSAAACGCVG